MINKNIKHIGNNKTVCPFAKQSIKTKNYLTCLLTLSASEKDFLGDLITKGHEAIINIDIPKNLTFDELQSRLIDYKAKIAAELWYTTYKMLHIPIEESIKKFQLENGETDNELETTYNNTILDKNKLEQLYKEQYEEFLFLQDSMIVVGDIKQIGFTITYMGPQYHSQHARYLPNPAIIIVRNDKFENISDETADAIINKIEKQHDNAGIIRNPNIPYVIQFITPY